LGQEPDQGTSFATASAVIMGTIAGTATEKCRVPVAGSKVDVEVEEPPASPTA